jgi:hypothetical protein
MIWPFYHQFTIWTLAQGLLTLLATSVIFSNPTILGYVPLVLIVADFLAL